MKCARIRCQLILPVCVGRFASRGASASDHRVAIAVCHRVAVDGFASLQHRVVGQIRIPEQAIDRVTRRSAASAADDRVALIVLTRRGAAD